MLLVLCALACPTATQALTDEEQHKLNRLEEQADQAIGQGDPEGAALTIGKAALLASQTAKNHLESGRDEHANTLASLYRTQEHAYRAIALFQQSGSQFPASSGVCQTLTQGIAQSARSLKLSQSPTASQVLPQRLHQQIMEWDELLRELQKDFGCLL